MGSTEQATAQMGAMGERAGKNGCGKVAKGKDQNEHRIISTLAIGTFVMFVH